VYIIADHSQKITGLKSLSVMFLKGLPAVYPEGLPAVFPADLTTFTVPVTFFVVAMHEQSESTISINPHNFSLFNGQAVFHYLGLPQLTVDMDVTRGSQSIFSDTSEPYHRVCRPLMASVVGTPRKGEKGYIFRNPERDEAPDKPRRKAHPSLNQGQH